MTKRYNRGIRHMPKVVGLVASKGIGMTAVSIAWELGISVDLTQSALTAAKVEGVLVPVWHARQGCFWWTVDRAEAAKAAAHALTRAGIRARKAEWQAVAREKRKAGVVGPLEPMPDNPIRRWAPASEPLPFVCTAPSSVFALGAA